MAGLVRIAGVVADKAGTAVPVDADITVKDLPRYVSRGGDKLAHALQALHIDVTGVSALDVGASTGGFVDCLLQAGALRVIAVDVGHGQLADRIAKDARVHVLDRVNARYLAPIQLPYEPDFVTMDVSFISVAMVLPAVVGCLAAACEGVILVKPQFEAGPALVGKGGIVRDPAVHRQVLVDRGRFVIERLGVELLGLCASGLRGADGNQEFFLHIGRGRGKGLGLDRLGEVVEETLAGGDAASRGVGV